MNEPIRVFFDASVVFAAIYSSQGYARDLLLLAVRGDIQAVASQDVLTEVERNITRKAPQQLATLRRLLRLAHLEIVADPSPEAVAAVAQYVADKDAAIVAAAITAQPDYLVTYDKKHLLNPDEVAARSGLQIVTPDVVVKVVRQE